MATASPSASPTPFLKPPPGVTSNFTNPPNLIGVTTLTIGVCVPLITIFFFLRTYVRIVIKRQWTVEDWLVFISWAGTTAFSGCLLNAMCNHSGEHGWDLTAAEAVTANYWFYVCSAMYGTMICFTKLAILALYRRVFSPRRWSPFDITIIVLVVVIIFFYVATVLVKIFQCTPRWKAIDNSLPGTCVNVPQVLNANGYFNTATDFIILFLPMKAVWSLQMERKRKLLLVGVFTFGLCAPAFSLVALVERLRVSGSPDGTYGKPLLLLWCCAELTTGNLCVCFPELGALLRLRNKTGKPAQSILNGSYHISDSRSKSRGRRPAGTSKGPRGMHRTVLKSPTGRTEGDSWLELNDMELYDVEAYGVHSTAESGSEDRERERAAAAQGPRQGEVLITTEVVVEEGPK